MTRSIICGSIRCCPIVGFAQLDMSERSIGDADLWTRWSPRLGKSDLAHAVRSGMEAGSKAGDARMIDLYSRFSTSQPERNKRLAIVQQSGHAQSTMKNIWLPIACVLVLTASPKIANDQPKAKPTSETTSLDDWLCAHVSPLFCPGIPDLRDHQATPRQAPQPAANTRPSTKGSKTR